MSTLTERTLVLGGVGVALAALESFGPFLWPYPLGTDVVTRQPGLVLLRRAAVGRCDARHVPARPGRPDVEAVPALPGRRHDRRHLGPTDVVDVDAQPAVDRRRQRRVRPSRTGLPERTIDRPIRSDPRRGRLSPPCGHAGWHGSSSGAPATAFDKVGFSPRNPYVLWPDATLAWLFGPIAIVAIAGLLYVAMLVGLWRHWQRASPALRRALLPITVAAPLQLAIIVAWHLADANASGLGDLRSALQQPVVDLAGVVFPVGFLLGLVRTRLSRGAIADLALELGRGVPLGSLRDTLARALRDPTLQVAFPAPSRRRSRRSGRSAVRPSERSWSGPRHRASRARWGAARDPQLRPGHRGRGSRAGRGRRVDGAPGAGERTARRPGPGAARGGPSLALAYRGGRGR